MVITGSPKISDWHDADQALGRLGELRRQCAALVITRDAAIQAAKDQCARQGAPLIGELAALEERLQRFLLGHEDDLDGRSRKLTHGRVGLLLVKQLSVRNIKKAIAWLVEARKMAYLRVEHKLNKEALTDAPAELLRSVGAKVQERDQCWYEVDGTRYAVED